MDSKYNNYEFMLNLVKRDGYLLRYASNELKNNFEIVLAAVKQEDRGDALVYASDSLKNNFKIVLNAVKNRGEALLYASNELRRNYDIVIAAAKQNTWEMGFLNRKFYKCRQMVPIIRPQAIRYF